MKVTADFCLIPMTNDASIAPHIASVQHILERRGLAHSLHGYGTNVEGEWDEVMAAIKECHEVVHKAGVLRISTSIRVGTRLDKITSNQAKIESVQQLMEK